MDEELPRGKLSEHTVNGPLRKVDANVELCDELWDVEYDYLTLPQFTEIVTSTSGILERRIAVARAMNPTLNNEFVDFDDIDPGLGMELATYLDKKLAEPPGKN